MTEVIKGAFISDCGKYRYTLSRVWDSTKPSLTFVMLNPSTADSAVDDPTIRRCIGYARRDGYGGITVVNLFAIRATDPEILLDSSVDREGEYNVLWQDQLIRKALDAGTPIVCAWGSHKAAAGVGTLFAEKVERRGVKAVCLGYTKAGAPRHPLYVSKDQPFVPYHSITTLRTAEAVLEPASI